MADGYEPSGYMPTEYDRTLDRLNSQQLVTKTSPKQIRTTPVFGIGGSTTYSITTFRIAGDVVEENEEAGTVKRTPARFAVALEVGAGDKLTRLVLPDEVLATIVRQREGLSNRAARQAAKQAAATRKARGIQPAFLKKAK